MKTTTANELAQCLKQALVDVANGHASAEDAYISLCALMDQGAADFGLPRDTVGFTRLAEMIYPIAFPKAYFGGPLRLEGIPPEALYRSYARSIGLCLGRAEFHGTEQESAGAKLINEYISQKGYDDWDLIECGDRNR